MLVVGESEKGRLISERHVGSGESNGKSVVVVVASEEGAGRHGLRG